MGKSIRIIADNKQIYDFGQYMKEKSQDFKDITSKMDATIRALQKNWDGTDATTFIANATAYIENLKLIENSLDIYGTWIVKKASQFNNIGTAFYENSSRGQ